MSRNIIELLTRFDHGRGGPTALDLLRRAVDDHGAVTDDDRRRASTLSGLPEAMVHGVSTYYDDLTQPRGRRHVRVCTGTACWAASGAAAAGAADSGGQGGLAAHVSAAERALGVRLGTCAADGSLSLAETVCLGLCHSGPAYRDADTTDAGPGALERIVAGSPREAAEPEWRSLLDDPVLLRPGDFGGLRHAVASLSPAELLAEVRGATLRGRGGAGFPAGQKWEYVARNPAPPAAKFIVVNGDEGDPGSYIDKLLMEWNPALLLEGMALAGYAVGAARGLVYVRSEYPRSKPALEAAIARAVAAGELGEGVLGSGFDFHIEVREGAGSYVVGEETALLASLHGLRGTVSARPPFPAERGYRGLPTVVNNVETLCNVPYIARHGAAAYAALSPGATSGTKLICLNERFLRPAVYEVPFGITLREICERLGGGLRDGHAIKALQIGGPLGGLLPGSRLDTPFDFEPLAAEGCMLGHGGIVAFDERTDMRDLARHLLRFGAHESCGKCFPCRIGLTRALELVEGGTPVDRAALEELLETLEVASLCAHGGGMPAPIRSILRHWPRELGAA